LADGGQGFAHVGQEGGGFFFGGEVVILNVGFWMCRIPRACGSPVSTGGKCLNPLEYETFLYGRFSP
jgi:hypothetical protein